MDGNPSWLFYTFSRGIMRICGSRGFNLGNPWMMWRLCLRWLNVLIFRAHISASLLNLFFTFCKVFNQCQPCINYSFGWIFSIRECKLLIIYALINYWCLSNETDKVSAWNGYNQNLQILLCQLSSGVHHRRSCHIALPIFLHYSLSFPKKQLYKYILFYNVIPFYYKNDEKSD